MSTPQDDKARIDRLEELLASGQGSILLSAWFSKRDSPPDGFAVSLNSLKPNPDECISLRVALDQELWPEELA